MAKQACPMLTFMLTGAEQNYVQDGQSIMPGHNDAASCAKKLSTLHCKVVIFYEQREVAFLINQQNLRKFEFLY